MPAIKKDIHPFKGSSKEAQAARAAHARQFSPFGPVGYHKTKEENPELIRRWHQKGVDAMIESKKQRKTLSYLMKAFLDRPVVSNVMEAHGLDNLFPGIDASKITFGMLLTASVCMRGIAKGEGLQYSVIRDTIGEKPKDQLALTGEDGQPLNPPVVNVSFLKGQGNVDDG